MEAAHFILFYRSDCPSQVQIAYENCGMLKAPHKRIILLELHANKLNATCIFSFEFQKVKHLLKGQIMCKFWNAVGNIIILLQINKSSPVGLQSSFLFCCLTFFRCDHETVTLGSISVKFYGMQENEKLIRSHCPNHLTKLTRIRQKRGLNLQFQTSLEEHMLHKLNLLLSIWQ